MTPPTAEAPEGRSERRLVTALFIDVVGSTALTVELGPERVKHLLDRVFTELSAIIAREGGTVEKYVGDAIHALFGAPTAHADDPLRALRAAHGCLAWVAARPATEVRLAVRAGIETGDALVDLAAVTGERHQMSLGACVNVAARLQQTASPGQVLVGPGCREAAGDGPELEALGDTEVRGVGRVPIWRLVAPAGSRSGARLPLVGREADLDLLQSAYRRSRTGRSVLVLVSGPPGQGKTRLVEELVALLSSEATVLVARCRPAGEAAAASPLRELAGGTAAGSQAALVARLAEVLDDPAERQRVGAAVAHSAGIDASEELTRLSKAERQDEIVNGWRRYLGALAAVRPVVAWIEDVHWADPEVMRILDRVSAGVAAPLLVVITARPEFREHAGLRPGGDRFFLELGALAADAARTLGRQAGGPDAPGVERAEGNPLFVIELARTRAAVPAGSLPITLQGAIGARLDELPPRDRELLQRAAVVGERITVPVAAGLARRDPAEVAGTLERLADLLYLDPAPGGYAFHHALVRDVAYGRLPIAERLRLHARHAREGIPPGDVERRAHHLWEALRPPDAEWVWEGDPRLPELRAEARAALLATGQRHAERFASQPALEAYRRALVLGPDATERSVLAHAMGAAFAADGRGDEAWAHYLEARDLHRQAGAAPPDLYADLLALAVWHPGMFQHAPDDDLVGQLLEEGEALAREARATPALARLLVARALRSGDTAPVDEAWDLAAAGEDPLAFAPVLVLAAGFQVRSGDFPKARRTFERIDRLVAAGARVDQPDEYRTALALGTGDLAEAEASVRRFLAANATRGPHLRTHAHREQAHLLLARGDWDGLVHLAREVERIVQENPGTAFCYAVTTARALAAVALALRGRRDDGLAWLSRPEGRLTSLPFSHEEVLLLAHGALGQGDQAGELLAQIYRAGQRIPYYVRRTEAVVLTMLERWTELDEPLGALAETARGSRYIEALVAAIGEERAHATGGPLPGHAALRSLGYFGWSALLGHRPVGS